MTSAVIGGFAILPRFKTALLAGAALTAAFATTAGAADRPLPEPVRIEHAVIADAGSPDEPASAPVKGWAIYAGAAAVIAALMKLIGARRLAVAAAAVGPAARMAAGAVANAAAGAGRAFAKAVGSPFRAMLFAAGLGLFALTGVGLYDVEWLAGLLFGAFSAVLVVSGLGKLRKSVVPARVKARR